VISDSLISKPINVKVVEDLNKMDWNVWFLVVAILSLIAALLVPFVQKKYEEKKSNYAFKLYIKKKYGIIFHLVTYESFSYKYFQDNDLKNEELNLLKFIKKFEYDYKEFKNTIHPLYAFKILYNFQNLIFVTKRIQNNLQNIDLKDANEKSLQFGDKLSNEEHNKLSKILLISEHYNSITEYNDKFSSLKAIQREIKDNIWIGLKVNDSVLKQQKLILEDLTYLRKNELHIEEILHINKLLIQEIKIYFDSLEKEVK